MTDEKNQRLIALQRIYLAMEANNKIFNLYNDLGAIEILATRLTEVRKWKKIRVLSAGKVPLLVIIGYQNVGKSSLFGALLGKKVNFVSALNGSTTRPLKLSILCSEDGRTVWEVLVDGIDHRTGLPTKKWQAKTQDEVADFIRLANENQAFSATPVEVRVSMPGALQLNIIDLPGLQLIGDKENITILADITRSFLQNENAIAVCVEKADTDLNTLSGFKFVQEELSNKPGWTERVIMVHTMFDTLANQWQNYQPEDWALISKYFNRNDRSVLGYSNVSKFYLTLAHTGMQNVDPNDLHTSLMLASKEDQEFLKHVGIDDTVISRVGFTALRSHLHKVLNDFYQRNLVTLPQTIRQFEDFADQVQQMIDEVLPTNIRYRFLQAAQEITKKLEDLLAGYFSTTSKQFSRTFEQDVEECFPGAGLPSKDVIESVPYAPYKLCGGGQYRRMIAYLFKNTASIDAVALCMKLCPSERIAQYAYMNNMTEAARLAQLVTHCLEQYSTTDDAVDRNANCIERLFNFFIDAAIECLADDVYKGEDEDLSTYKWLKRYPRVEQEVKRFFVEFFAGLSQDVKGRMKHNKMQVEPSKLYVDKFSISPTDDVNGIVLGLSSLDVSARRTLGDITDLFNQPKDVIYQKMGEVFKAYLIDQLELMQQVLDSYYKTSLFRRLSVQASAFYRKYDDRTLLKLVEENFEQIEQWKNTVDELKDLCDQFRRNHM